MMAKDYFPISSRLSEFRCQPFYLLLLGLCAYRLLHNARVCPPDLRVDEEGINSDSKFTSEDLFVPKLWHSPIATSVIRMCGKVSLGTCIRVPVMVACDYVPRPPQRRVLQVHVEPPIHNELWIPFGATAIDVVPNPRNGRRLSHFSHCCQAHSYSLLIPISSSIVTHDEELNTSLSRRSWRCSSTCWRCSSCSSCWRCSCCCIRHALTNEI